MEEIFRDGDEDEMVDFEEFIFIMTSKWSSFNANNFVWVVFEPSTIVTQAAIT